MPPARPIFQRAARSGRSALFCVAGALAGAGLYAANLTYLNLQAPATLIASLPVPGLTSVALSEDGKTLAAGGNPGYHDHGRVVQWDTTDPARPVKDPQVADKSVDAVNQVAFTPLGLASFDGNKVTLWDPPTTDPDTPPGLKHPSTPKGHTVFIADGQVPHVGYVGGTVTLWNAADPSHPVTLDQPSRSKLRGHLPVATFTSDGRIVAFATGDGDVTLRNTDDPAHPLSHLSAVSGKGDWVNSMAFFSDRKTLVTGSDNNTVTLWNVTNPAHPVRLSRPLADTRTVTENKRSDGGYEYTPGSGNTVSLVAVSRNGETLAICNGDGTITLWDVTDPAQPVQVGQPIDANQTLGSLAFTPDGKTLITGTFDINTNGEKSQVKIWRLRL